MPEFRLDVGQARDLRVPQGVGAVARWARHAIEVVKSEGRNGTAAYAVPAHADRQPRERPLGRKRPVGAKHQQYPQRANPNPMEVATNWGRRSVLCEPRLSMTTMSPGRRVGTRTLLT